MTVVCAVCEGLNEALILTADVVELLCNVNNCKLLTQVVDNHTVYDSSHDFEESDLNLIHNQSRIMMCLLIMLKCYLKLMNLIS